ncbi:hypothetical protein AGR1A_pAt10088 [Agrobacterium fabacearum CFBP 5771]|nr:hypothetical protein AGR1A_pAt10088 [Agrobacterium fabacearum CFBP 5771]
MFGSFAFRRPDGFRYRPDHARKIRVTKVHVFAGSFRIPGARLSDVGAGAICTASCHYTRGDDANKRWKPTKSHLTFHLLTGRMSNLPVRGTRPWL